MRHQQTYEQHLLERSSISVGVKEEQLGKAIRCVLCCPSRGDDNKSLANRKAVIVLREVNASGFAWEPDWLLES